MKPVTVRKKEIILEDFKDHLRTDSISQFFLLFFRLLSFISFFIFLFVKCNIGMDDTWTRSVKAKSSDFSNNLNVKLNAMD